MERKPIQVVYDGGIYLPEVELWLDPHRKKPRAFVSHAHADHVAAHTQSLCSTTNKRILATRFSSRREVVGYEFGEEFEMGASVVCCFLRDTFWGRRRYGWSERRTGPACSTPVISKRGLEQPAKTSSGERRTL